MSIKQQLREFYANQGITGKALRSAMRYDLRSIRKQRTYPTGSIEDVIGWGNTVEGPGYWLSRSLGFPSYSYRGEGNCPRRILR